MPASTKLRRRYPSFEATSTTRLSGPSPRSATSRRACSARVAHEAGREGREVEVVVDEQLLGGDVLEDLDERAARAEGDVERIPRFRERELLRAQKSIGQRHVSRARGRPRARHAHERQCSCTIAPALGAAAATASGTRALERRLAPPELLVERPLLLQLAYMLQTQEARRLEVAPG